VRDLVERCSCPSQFPMVKVSEGKYRIGDTRVLIFVRILRNHVMVRVGGGWDTLEHYLDKHDPCRCRQGHRIAVGSRVGFKTSSSGQERQLMNVTYDRKRPQGSRIMSTRERVNMQQITETARNETPLLAQEAIILPLAIPEGKCKTNSTTVSSAFVEDSLNQMQFEGVPGEGLPVNMLEKVNIQNENGCLTEESSVCKTVESLMKNTEAPMLSDITLKPEVKCNVQNSNSSVENFSKEVPILSGVEKEVALVKSCRTLSPTSIQTKKIHTKIKKSSLPVLRDTKCQTTWGRTGVLDVLGYHSKEKCSDKKSPNTVNVQDTDSILDNLPDSSET
ncbi:hypothetical protein OTU49_013904, partial [Cherax quadricarinatus]